MPRILRASLARTDLLGIWAHIAAESSAPIADNVLARLYGALEVLASAPYIGRERPEFAGGPRSLAVRPYLIFYEPLADGDGIAIWRVLRGAWRTCCAGRLGSINRREGSVRAGARVRHTCVAPVSESSLHLRKAGTKLNALSPKL